MGLSRRAILQGAAASAFVPCSAVLATSYPSRPIKIVVPFAAGGTLDPPIRILTEAMSKLAGQTLVVENRAGAGGTLGADNVAKAEPDGYALLASSGSMTISQTVYARLPWNVATDFKWIGNFGTLPSVLVVNTGRVPVSTLAEFVVFANSRSDELNYGSPGFGTASHLAGEMLKERAGFKMRHVSYRGGAPAVTDLRGGQIDAMVAGLSSVTPLLGAPNIKVIAVTGRERSTLIPDVQTVAETVTGFSAETWLGLAGPAKFSADIQKRLAYWMEAVLQVPDVRRRLIELGVTPGFDNAEKVSQIVTAELGTISAIVKRIGIQPIQ
ncbi:Bug family tripartite tricarboxylate transporter substrate binding protein [Rhodopseudomonas sp. P2A-2r]|uniref:Bug family tripartite tricarboxylate transporter substrate binding protein n=1 Tax=unclassified Rhodopseudomonas TaxID=2638247 RepID=UPI0022341B70|nr:tripartite tricarboxylate transporter substrate-binding protein [Rhodopseudomonas sp. P2A-2r]UZE51064.1 tripartite tricarboxylate transporter substrate-binding protein [Rhodopseudomonas sp. P2A-2r]